MERKDEWTSEGEQKRETGVWETELTLRKQRSAYDSMHRVDASASSGVAPQVREPVPALLFVMPVFLLQMIKIDQRGL